MASRDPRDRRALLCERCGYVIEGLPESGNCPECGMAIAESLPERREGSPWQRDKSWRGIVRTNWRVIRHPFMSWDDVRIQNENSAAHIVVNVAIGCLMGFALSLPVRPPRDALNETHGYRDVVLGALIILLIQTCIAVAVCFLLTMIEIDGVRLIAARRGWRISLKAAWAICAHASVGWLIACAGVEFVFQAWTVRPQFWGTLFSQHGAAVAILSVFFFGMLVFETLVYLGMRRMRYANLPRAMPSRSSDPD